MLTFWKQFLSHIAKWCFKRERGSKLKMFLFQEKSSGLILTLTCYFYILAYDKNLSELKLNNSILILLTQLLSPLTMRCHWSWCLLQQKWLFSKMRFIWWECIGLESYSWSELVMPFLKCLLRCVFFDSETEPLPDNYFLVHWKGENNPFFILHCKDWALKMDNSTCGVLSSSHSEVEGGWVI